MEVASRNWCALPSVAMLNRDYEGQNCSIARALEVVGERWTLLIIRDVLLGLHRFDEFQESLGIARNVLTDRLNRLVEEGVLERVEAFAAQGVTRGVVAATATDPAQQREELSAFAQRFGLLDRLT